ncbi:MAG: hypothetical protein Hens2KO_11540 [Henriciella sp.]
MQSLNHTFPLALFVATIVAPNAIAEDFYVEGTVGQSSFDFRAIESHEYTMIGIRAGKNLTQYLAIEGEYSFGASEVSRTFEGLDTIQGNKISGDATQKLNAAYGVFGKATLPLMNNFTAHARVGYATTEREGEAKVTFEDGTVENRTYEDIDPGLAYGVGTTFSFSDKIYMRADATRYQAFDTDIEAYTIGAGLRF